MGMQILNYKTVVCLWCQIKIFLGATPDGIVRGADAIDGLLEIKCPFSICNEVPTADNLPYLNLSDNGEIHLHKNMPIITRYKRS